MLHVQDLRALAEAEAEHAVSVSLPTHAAGPETRQGTWRKASGAGTTRAAPARRAAGTTPLPSSGATSRGRSRRPRSAARARAACADPTFGTLDDFDRLLDALHRRGIRLSHILLSTHLDRDGEPVAERLHLRPDEGVIIRLDKPGSGGG